MRTKGGRRKVTIRGTLQKSRMTKMTKSLSFSAAFDLVWTSLAMQEERKKTEAKEKAGALDHTRWAEA